ncbi:MAG: alkaline phosphatase family protein [Chloroflexota bacterium]|nr:alkaline phosphatase family protein [Chloroflexota bacterium]MDE2894461.1 alkaline phosphatase family protein [Chloroflexota bacterium]
MASADVERVERWFRDGDLLHPFEGDAPPSTVDLARAIASIGGVPLSDQDSRAAELAERIGRDRPLLFVLVDGLGCVFDELAKPGGLLAGAEGIQLRSVFPSTTAAALTTLATGAWPCQHGVPAWYTHLHRNDLTATILPFVERNSERKLQEFGIRPSEAFAYPSRMASIEGRLRTYHPRAISNSEFTSYQRGSAPTDPYDHLRDAARNVVSRIVEQDEPGIHYLYLPMVDSASHRDGPHASATMRALEAVDQALGTISEQLDGRARIAISADHGELQVSAAEKSLFLPDDPLLDDLHTPPHGEPRVPMFCVKRGREAAFEGEFRERWGRHWALLTRAEAEEMQLFGPDPMTPLAAERIGSHLALSATKNVLVYGEAGNRVSALNGYHAGLRSEEMEIPLLLA